MPIAKSETVQPDGETVPIYIEVDTLDALKADPTSIYSAQETREKAAQKVMTVAGDVFGESVQLIRDCAAKVAHGLEHLPDGMPKPEEVELQLAIKVDADLGVAVLAKISPGALMQVTLRWQLGDHQ
jgi:Trypsin-co-occurring domain 1